MLKAVTRRATSVDAKIRAINAAAVPGTPPISTAAFFDHHASADDVDVLVTEVDFAAAQAELVPSVSATELAHYERVRASFEGARQGSAGKAAVEHKAGPAALGKKDKGKQVASLNGIDVEDRDGAARKRAAKGKGRAEDEAGVDDDGLY